MPKEKPYSRKLHNKLLTERPEGMSQDEYKKERKRLNKLEKVYLRGEQVPFGKH